ncbi:hypothetical protein N7523_004051 [Penicillium sp. IBT 18751x]|nr:hypothetical protein N7523_004051 [Penicillium sp. IBT 18751x]
MLEIAEHPKSSLVHDRPLNAALDGPVDFIFDIRQDKENSGLCQELKESIQSACSNKTAMPDLLLWDEEGLRYFEDITRSTNYYLTNAEIHILNENSFQIAQQIGPGGLLVELGSGNLRKTSIILQALDELGYEVDYFALDVSFPELRRTLRQLPTVSFKHVRCFGLLGTYDDGRRWLHQTAILERQTTILSLGSTLGSFSRRGCAEFLSSFLQPHSARHTQPSFLVGLDGCKDAKKVFEAYNDSQGLNRKFIKHGLERANELLGYNAFDLSKWDVAGYWDEHNGRHEQLYTTLTTVELNGIPIVANQTLRATWSHKYDGDDLAALCRDAGLQVVNKWSSAEEYSVCYLRPTEEDTNRENLA